VDEKLQKTTQQDRAEGSLMGMPVGDALGAPFEFEKIKKINDLQETLKNPLAMSAGGKFSLKAGQWTDDSSQGLCLVEAFLENAAKGQKGFEPKRLMDLFYSWWREKRNNGLGGLESVGIGSGTAITLRLWLKRVTDDPIEHSFQSITNSDQSKRCDGNGSTMRCAAPAVFAKSLDDAMYFAYQQSLVITPGLKSAACAALVAYLSYQVIHFDLSSNSNETKQVLLSSESFNHFLEKLLFISQKFPKKHQIPEDSEDYRLIRALCTSNPMPPEVRMYKITKTRNGTGTDTKKAEVPKDSDEYKQYIDQIEEGKGKHLVLLNKVTVPATATAPATTKMIYLKKKTINSNYLNWRSVHADYELDSSASDPGYYGSYVLHGMALVLHILRNTNSFDEAVKMAALMRGDADSNAAVTGIIAGAIYGRSSINPEWLHAINQHPLNKGNTTTIVPFLENAVLRALNFTNGITKDSDVLAPQKASNLLPLGVLIGGIAMAAAGFLFIVLQPHLSIVGYLLIVVGSAVSGIGLLNMKPALQSKQPSSDSHVEDIPPVREFNDSTIVEGSKTSNDADNASGNTPSGSQVQQDNSTQGGSADHQLPRLN
jgi:ADP-ribosylglycohydrolase